MTTWTRYDREATDLSLGELRNFAKWMNTILGYSPTVIGGWAVYFHHPGLGSRDIDVLLPTWEMKDRIITKYLVNNGYELRQKGFGAWELIKFLVPGDPTSEIYLDICTMQDRNIVHGRDIEVPWSIASKWQHLVDIGGGEMYIPDPEPLLVLKAKAAWDRNFDVVSGAGDDFKRDKVKKDRYDLISLLGKCEFRKDVLKEIVQGSGFGECFTSALLETVTDKDALAKHGLDKGEAKDLERKAKRLLKGITKSK